MAQSDQVEAAIEVARREVARANYPAALVALEGALRLAPGDQRLREMIAQVSKAALRHDAAVDRNRAVAQTAEHVNALIEGGQLEAAATELREANLKFGKHTALMNLQQRYEAKSKEAELERTVAFVDEGRVYLERRDWQGALQQAERVLRLDPKNADALTLRQQARIELERDEARRQAAQEITQAQVSIERLIQADELPRADRALQQARDRLGNHDIFNDLAKRLDQAKAELQARKRLEWTQRRLTEADDLVKQATRLSLQGKWEEAIARLNQARELHPEHPDVEAQLQAAHAAHKKALVERNRSEALAAAKVEARQLLDGLRLDEASARLTAAVSRFGEDAQFEALATRLDRLRQGATPATPFSPATPDDDALARQREMVMAYSWKQTLLYAFRDSGLVTFWILVGLAVGLELADDLPWVGLGFLALRWLLPVAVLGASFEIIRETWQGGNSLPAWTELFEARRWGRDLGLVLAMTFLVLLPLFVLGLTRGWHGLFDGAPGWWIAAVLAWPAAAFLVLAGGAAAVFGHSWGVARHVRALKITESESLLAVNLLYGLVLAIAVLRVTFLPYIPWMGSPLAAALEAYTLLTIPHLVGVMLRRHRIELTRVYGGG